MIVQEVIHKPHSIFYLNFSCYSSTVAPVNTTYMYISRGKCNNIMPTVENVSNTKMYSQTTVMGGRFGDGGRGGGCSQSFMSHFTVL